MKKESSENMKDELRQEYDLSKLLQSGVRGKYADRFRAGTNLDSLPVQNQKDTSKKVTIEKNLKLARSK